MAEDKRKTETITVRVDLQTKFMVEFLARFHGQSLTTVVERALAEAAQVTFPGEDGKAKGWMDFWYDSEPARTLAMAGEAKLHPPYADRMRRRFAENFWPFFFKGKDCTQVNEANANVLYPMIDEFKYLFEERPDFQRPARAMAERLKEAGLVAPDWPYADALIPQANDPLAGLASLIRANDPFAGLASPDRKKK